MAWMKVARRTDLQNGQGVQVPLPDRTLALFNIEGKFYAIDDTCSHAGGSLAEGAVAGQVVTCPWHGAEFDVTTGAALAEPAFEGVQTYPVKVEGEDVLIEV